MKKIQYIDKAKVLKIVGEDSEQAQEIEKLQAFVLPERNGEWIAKEENGFHYYECSVCGYSNIVEPYFCECCGARMRVKEE